MRVDYVLGRWGGGIKVFPHFHCFFMIFDPRAPKKVQEARNRKFEPSKKRCVFEMFCAFLMTSGGKQARPMLLVKGGRTNPSWISPLECQKLAVGTSVFQCCEANHESDYGTFGSFFFQSRTHSLALEHQVHVENRLLLRYWTV